jgi:GNAT superfamily N-acetyltransferase
MGPLFVAGAWRCSELRNADAPSLQRFYDDNPAYSLMVEGMSPPLDSARETLDAHPPAGWPYGRKWVLGFAEDDGESLVGMADLLSDLFTEGVWHLGLFMVATSLQGQGVASALYEGLEAWMIERGALFGRLGVVVGNARAERFWERCGYREVRRREAVPMGRRVNDIRVMVKPLAEGSVVDYLALVARDRPETT